MTRKNQEGKESIAAPCEDCPPRLARDIDIRLDTCKVLARKGLWTVVMRLINQLRAACMSYQPNTLDPFEVPLADTELISAHVRNSLESIGVIYVGQLGSVPRAELRKLRIGPVGMRQLRRLCRQYAVPLRRE